ncbi:heterokaryon incompatibility protein-domain-containing protein [Plectosphaerella cucumerina]|uniref:Heterokaryon incompatibility protein-domain-containing protein n=1 Tax=Plectosphaerella cucumerina TaxID=40658 RepID=A0A8K0TU10_9PEZI|nr:heterokaryon incompatibility protein-domain-containing protein [Plectosphaerella cucumerina]
MCQLPLPQNCTETPAPMLTLPDDTSGSSTSPCTDLRTSAALIRRWLSACLRDHAADYCYQDFPGRALHRPKRLVELDPLSSTFRLIHTSPLPSLPPYVAISYVWGTKGNNLTTTTAAVSRLSHHTPFSSLPKTIRDACHITCLIGLRHIWVDALCIVQDDDVEKAVEIADMGSVYWDAWLQIAAMRSRDADDGLLPPAGGSPPTPEEMDEHRLVMSACRSLKQRVWDGKLLERYPLLTRGWTFQERILARRCVHFTCIDLVWECKRERWFETPGENEGGGAGAAKTAINNLSGAFLQCVRLGNSPGHDSTLAKTVPVWRQFVMSYSKRYLTDMDDRLLAISGIAGMIRREARGSVYAAGLWADAMPFDLLWRCDMSSGNRLKETKKREPSWSWCSVDCGVDWPALEKQDATCSPLTARPPHEDPLEYVGRGTYFEEGLKGVQVVSLQLDAPAGVFGQVHGGVVELESRIVPVRVQKREGTNWKALHETDWAIVRLTDDLAPPLPYYPDLKLVDGQSPQHLLFIEVVSHQVGERRWEAGLVVVAVSGSDAYARVGMAGRRTVSLEEDPRGWFEGADRRVVRVC